MITVKDVWRGALPAETELLGGGAGLERRVEWATSLRTRPPAFEAIKGGEVAFVPVRTIRLLDERLDLAQVMRSFAEKGGVAVAVQGDVSAAALEVAERMMLPLLQLPAGTHIADVQQTTVRFIIDQRTLLHERQQELSSQLMALALGGAGLAAIADRLAELTGRGVVWQDQEGRIQHATRAVLADDGLAAALEEGSAAVRRWAEGLPVLGADPPVHELPVGGSGRARLVAPIPVRDGLGGFISVVAAEADLDQLARLAVSRAASACAIELDRERAVLAARDELEGEFLESLLAGTYSSEAAVRHRAERLGFDLGGDVVVLVARPDRTSEAGLTRARRDQLAVGAQGWIRRRAPTALATVRHGSVAAILPIPGRVGGAATPASAAPGPASAAGPGVARGSTTGAPPPRRGAGDGDGLDLRRVGSDLRLECAGAMGGAELSVGIGRPKAGIAGVRASHREAEQALTMGARLFGAGRVTGFADLGLYRLLFAMQGHTELREFFEDQVRPVVDYDTRTGAGLMRTLDAYFRCHGSPTEIAGLLHLHRNTVLYRLRRIEDIGRLRLDNPETRLNLHLCLKVREVLQAAGG